MGRRFLKNCSVSTSKRATAVGYTELISYHINLIFRGQTEIIILQKGEDYNLSACRVQNLVRVLLYDKLSTLVTQNNISSAYWQIQYFKWLSVG